MMNAVLGRLSQSYGHVQRPDRQISLHTITDSPADDTPRIKIEDDGKIEPALAGPNVRDITRLLPDRVMQSMIPRGHF
jgi:hypothetical protein